MPTDALAAPASPDDSVAAAFHGPLARHRQPTRKAAQRRRRVELRLAAAGGIQVYLADIGEYRFVQAGWQAQGDMTDESG